MPNTADIVIRSFYKDFGWLKFCLQSITKYCHGFRNVLLAVPEGSEERLRMAGIEASWVLYCQKSGDDYLGQQVTKLYADTLTDADFIVHVDSDCIFKRSCSPADLLTDNRPQILMTCCSLFSGGAPWQGVTERFLCERVDFDFMRRQPLMYPRWLYKEIRQQCRKLHLKELADYVASQPPLGFSEFNALGAFAFRHYRDFFEWVETDDLAFDEKFCRIFWSWGGLHDDSRSEIQSILNPRDLGD